MKVLTLRPKSTVASQGNWTVVNSSDHADAVDDVTHFSVATIPDLSGNTYYGQAQDLYQFFTTSTTLQQANVGTRSANAANSFNPNDGTAVTYSVTGVTASGTAATYSYTQSASGAIPNTSAYISVSMTSTATAYNITNALITAASSTSFTVASTASAGTVSATGTATQAFAQTGGDFFLYVNDITRFRSGQIVAILEGLQQGQTPYSAAATSTDAYYSEWLDFTATGVIPNVPYKQSVDPVDYPTSSLMLPQGYQNISTVMSPNLQFYKPPANKYMGQFLSAAQSTAYILGQAPTPYAVGNGSASPWYVATSGDAQALSNLTSILPDATVSNYATATPPTVLSISIGYFSTAINVSSTAYFAVGQTVTISTKPQTTLTPASMGWNAGKIISISDGWIVTDLSTQTQRQTVIAGSGNTTNLTLNPSAFVMQLPNAGFSGIVTNASTTIQGVLATQGIQVGMVVTDSTTSTNIPATTYVTAVNSTSGTITMSSAAAGSSSQPDSVSYTATLGGGSYISTANTTVGVNQAVTNASAGYSNALVASAIVGTAVYVNQTSSSLLSGASFTNSATYTVASNPTMVIASSFLWGNATSLPYLSPTPTGWAHIYANGVGEYSTGTWTTASVTATVASTATYQVGATVFGTGIPNGTTIVSIGAGTVTFSKTPTANGTATSLWGTTYSVAGYDATGYGTSAQRVALNAAPSNNFSNTTFTSTFSFVFNSNVAATAGANVTPTITSVNIGTTAYSVTTSGTFTVGATAYNISTLFGAGAPFNGGSVIPSGRVVLYTSGNGVTLGPGSVTTVFSGVFGASTNTFTGTTGETVYVTKAGTTQDNILVSGSSVSSTYLPAGTTFASSLQKGSGPVEMLLSATANTVSWSTTSAVVANAFTGTIYPSTLNNVVASPPLGAGDSILVYNGATLLGNTTVYSVSGSTVTLGNTLISGGYQTYGTSITGSASFNIDELYAVGNAVAFNVGNPTATWSLGATTISLSSTAGVYTGMSVQGSGIPFGAQVSNISGTTVALGYPSLVTGDNYNQAGGTVGNWQAGPNSTLSVALGTGFNTSNSLLLTRINNTAGYCDAYLPMSSITNFKVQPNQTYVVGIDILANSTAYGKVYQLDVRDQNNNRLNTLQMTMNTSAGVWQFFEMSFTPPVGTTTLGLFISDDPQSSPVSGAAVNINNIFLVLAGTTSNTQISNGYAPAITTSAGTAYTTPLSISSAQYNFSQTGGYQSSYTTNGFLTNGSNSYYTNNQADGSFLSGMAIQGNNLPAGTIISQTFLQDEFVSGKPVTVTASIGATAYTLSVSNVVTGSGFTSTTLQNLCVGQVVSGTGIPASTVITNIDTVNKYITLSHQPSSAFTGTFTTALFAAQTFTVSAPYTVSGTSYYFTTNPISQITGFMLGMIVSASTTATTNVATIINISGGNIYLSNDINGGSSNSSGIQFNVSNGFVSLSNAASANTTQRDTYTVSYAVPQSNTGIFGATIDSTVTRLNTDSGNKFDETFFTAPYLSIDGYNNPNHGQFLIMPVTPTSIKSNPVANALSVASHSPNASTTVEGVGIYANVTQSVVFQGTYTGSGTSITVTDQSGTFPTSPTNWLLYGPRGHAYDYTPAYSVDVITPAGTTFTASATSTASATLTSVTNISSLFAGMSISGANIPANTTISSVNTTASTVVLSANPTATFGGETITVPYTTLHTTTNLVSPTIVSPTQMVFSAPLQVSDITGLSSGQYVSGDIVPYSSNYNALASTKGISGPFIYNINQTAQVTAYLGDVAYGTSTILNISSTANTAAGLNGTNGLLVGQTVSYTGFPSGTVIISVDSATQVTVSNPAIATVLQDTIDFNYYNVTLCEWVNPGSVTGGTPFTGFSGMYPIGGTQSNALLVAGVLQSGVTNVSAGQVGGTTYTLYLDTVANLEASPSYSWTGYANGNYNGITGVSPSATPYIHIGDAVVISPQNVIFSPASTSATQFAYNICFVSAIVLNGSTYTVYLVDNQSNPFMLTVGSTNTTFTTYTPNYVFYQSRLAVLEVDAYSNSAIVWAVDGENFLTSAFTTYPNGDSQTAILPLENTATIYSAYTSPALDASGIKNAGVVMMSGNTSFNHAAGTLVGSYDVGDRYFGSDTVGDQEVLTPTTIGSLFGTTVYATATSDQNYIVVSPLNSTSVSIGGTYYDQYGNIASQGISPTTGTTITGVTTVAGNYYMTLPTIASPNISVGWMVKGNGIPNGTVVTYIDSGNIYLSNPISVSASSASYLFTPQVWGVMVVGEGDTQETVVFNGTYNFLSGAATGNTISPISIALAAGQKFQYNHFAGEPVVVPNIYTLDGFQNQHAAGALISAGAENASVAQGQQNLLADNTSGAQAATFDTTISLSPNWLTSSDNDSPSIATTLAVPASASATTLTITTNDLFPTSNYNNVINSGLFLPPEIGRVAGLVASGATAVPFLPNGSTIPSMPLFFVQIGYDVVQVSNVAIDATGAISPTGYYLSLVATTSATYVDGTPITLKMLDTNTTYNSLNVPHSYLNRSFSGSASVGSNVITNAYVTNGTLQPVSAITSAVSYTTVAGATSFNLSSGAAKPYVGMSMYGDTAIQPNTIVTAYSGSYGSYVVYLNKPLSGALSTSSTITFAYAVSGTNIPPLSYISTSSGDFSSGTGTVTLTYASGQPAYPTVTTTSQVTMNIDASLYSSGQYVSTLYISPAPCYLPSGSTIYLKSGLYTQIVTTSASVNTGDTSISVSPFIPVFDYIAANVANGAVTNFYNGSNTATLVSYGLINELSADQTIVLGSGTTPQELVVTEPEPFFSDKISVQPFIPLYNYDNTLVASGSFTAATTVATNTITLSTYSFSGYLTSGSATITGVSSISGLYTGEGLSGTGIPLNSYIVSMTASASGNFITMSQNASATTSNGTINAAPQVGQQLISTSVTGTFTANLTAGSTTIAGVSSTANLVVGTQITGAGIPYDTVITSISGSSAILNLVATLSATGETISFTTTAFSSPAFVTSVSGPTVTTNIPACATFSGTTLRVNPTTLTAPIELVVGNETLSEIVYPYTIPVLQTNGTYQMQIAAPLSNPYDTGTNVSFYAQPTAVSGDVRWKPDTQTIQKYDGTRWNDAEVASVQISVALQGAENGGDKHTYALTDLTTGDVAPADTYQNATNPAASS